jgi:flagellar basal-body rod protein FlgB
MINRLTDNLDFHSQALVLRSERQRLIAGNIANADTPGFKARDFDFAAALREASAGQKSPASDVMSATGRANLALRYATPQQANLDSNTVDMDRERANFMDNALKFDATLRFINASVRSTLDAMKSPHQG